MKISIVIPFYNERGNVNIIYKRLSVTLRKYFRNFSYEIIAVDDGSQDITLELLKKLRKKDNNIKIIGFSRNFGHHIAITAGLDHAAGDYIVMMDGDLQDQPEEIVNLFNKLKKGYDVVYAVRKNKKFGILKKLSSSLFNYIIKFLINENIIINSTIFRIMTKQVKESIGQLRESNRYIVGLVGWVGFKHGYCFVEHGERSNGKTKYNFFKQLDLAINAITSFSDYPLKIANRVGLLLVMASFVLNIYIIFRKFAYNTPIIGWTSLFSSIILIGGIQIILLGIMGEYLGKNYIESKKRPLYVIKTKLL
ncbi:glycosyltransferase family 2 protein [Candidatus Roizmanbacteria bacterium]|nr:glycosyltransferase family 2 protein [Candidatus Roizmanbacteria bacterium]